MATIIYKDGVQHRVEAHDLHRHLNAGYTLKNEPKSIEAKKEEVDYYAMYEAKFGEKPHHRMKLEKIIEKVNGN